MSVYNYLLANPFGPSARTLEWIYLNRTGGMVTDLDGESTLGADTSGTNCRIVAITNTTAEIWQLIEGSNPNDPPNGWIRPLDWTTENQKVWKRLFTFGTGGGVSGPDYFDVLVVEDIPAYSMVTAQGNRANSNNTAHYGKVVGIADAPYASGNNASLLDEGVVTNAGWSWTTGQHIFLNGTVLSATPPASGFSQKIGVARNADTIIMGLNPPILL